jgi:hypothetical protein
LTKSKKDNATTKRILGAGKNVILRAGAISIFLVLTAKNAVFRGA